MTPLIVIARVYTSRKPILCTESEIRHGAMNKYNTTAFYNAGYSDFEEESMLY